MHMIATQRAGEHAHRSVLLLLGVHSLARTTYCRLSVAGEQKGDERCSREHWRRNLILGDALLLPLFLLEASSKYFRMLTHYIYRIGSNTGRSQECLSATAI